jgi:hypothetical protein
MENITNCGRNATLSSELLSNESIFIFHSIQKRREDSYEDVCALSENWTFQPEIRRWSRVGDMGPLCLNLPKAEASKTTSRESTPEE